MNWLQRARREIVESAGQRTANSAEGIATAATAVPFGELRQVEVVSIGSNGSVGPAPADKSETLRDEFEERAAIMEFDGGLTREEAEREAWALVINRRRLH